MMRWIVSAVLLTASVVTAPALAAMSAVNLAFSQNLAARQEKVVLLPPQMFVFELSAGGVPTRMADWEAAARANLVAAATRQAHDSGLFERVPTHSLALAELDRLDAHIGLYDRVAQSVFVYGRGEQSAWAHKKNEFDYTVGPGLAFLRERTGDVQWMGFDSSSSIDSREPADVDTLMRTLHQTWPEPR